MLKKPLAVLALIGAAYLLLTVSVSADAITALLCIVGLLVAPVVLYGASKVLFQAIDAGLEEISAPGSASGRRLNSVIKL